jgi:periplasmic divalent cation tolerance protein
MPTHQAFQVSVTTGSREEADALATLAVERRLAACCQISGPVSSRYWWGGRLESAEEFACLFKTAADRLDELVAALSDAHSYEVPEIIAVPITAGHGPYLEWVVAETRR